MNWWRRFLRILDQDRIRLPKRPLVPAEIRLGDRLQIGHEVWTVFRARQSSEGLSDSFELIAEEASVPVARLFAPEASEGTPRPLWLLIKGAVRLEVPGEMIVAFPCGLVASNNKGKRCS